MHWFLDESDSHLRLHALISGWIRFTSVFTCTDFWMNPIHIFVHMHWFLDESDSHLQLHALISGWIRFTSVFTCTDFWMNLIHIFVYMHWFLDESDSHLRLHACTDFYLDNPIFVYMCITSVLNRISAFSENRVFKAKPVSFSCTDQFFALISCGKETSRIHIQVFISLHSIICICRLQSLKSFFSLTPILNPSVSVSSERTLIECVCVCVCV